MQALFIEMFDYTFWADRMMWECVQALTDQQYTQELSYSIGSVHTHCTHILSVEYWWPYFLKEGKIPDRTRIQSLQRGEISAEWEKVEAYVRAYLAGLTPPAMERRVKPPHWDEDEAPVQVWEALIQVVNHSTDHRAQVLRALHDFGVETFEQDYLNFLDQRSGLEPPRQTGNE